MNIFTSSLQRLHPRAFEGLPRLGALHIHSHSLQKAPELNPVGHTLTFFTLNNFEGTYEDIHLAPFVVLTSLTMENSGLTAVPKVVRCVAPTLRELDLSRNKLSTLDNMYDIPFPHLRSVDMDFNNISYLKPVLLRFPELEMFSIKHNKLTDLPDLSFCIWGMTSHAATYFILDKNPWHCNGSMTRLRKWLCGSWGEIYYRRLMLMIVLDNAYCQSPTELRGEAVVNIEKLNSHNINKCGKLLVY